MDSKAEVKAVGITPRQYVMDIANLAEAFANKKGFKKSTGYEIMVLNKLETLERLDDFMWIANPRKDQAKVYARKINLTELDSMKDTTLSSKVTFLQNFVDACTGHENDMRVIPFESTRKQKSKQALEQSVARAKAVFKI